MTAMNKFLDQLKKVGKDALAQGTKQLGKGLEELTEAIAEDLQGTTTDEPQIKPPTQTVEVHVKEVKSS